MNAVNFYRIEHWLWKRKVPILPQFIHHLIFLMFNSHIPASCTIGKGTRFAYGGIGVVIHANCVIGNDCIIGTNVTIGGRSGRINSPTIGNNVYISTGAKVLGDIQIDDNVIVGANAVVIKDVPRNAIVVGVPSKIVKYSPEGNRLIP